MKGLNLVHLVGNLGGDPEMKFTPAGTPVTTFSMATSRKYLNDQGDLVEETTWHRVITWKKLAELCNKALCKGDPVYIQGRIANRQWEDTEGNKHSRTEIIASEVIFLNPRQSQPEPELVAVEPEDLPF